MKKRKRAITLAGGGPCAGLQIGALQAFHEAGIKFDVWALSCIGAWVGVVYNSFDPETAPRDTEEFFRDNVFRNDLSYSRFPINHAFSPDIVQNTRALMKFMLDPDSYRGLIAPEAIQRTTTQWLQFLTDRSRWNEGDFDNLILETMAANPFARYLTSMMYLTPVNGLSRIYFKDSSFLKAIDFENVCKEDRPFLYHNAYDIRRSELTYFSNKPHPGVKQMSAASVCACSALPYVEETVEIDGVTYCEGALVETVNFKGLLGSGDHESDIDEVWIVRIVDKDQVRLPRNLKDGLANLCMLFAGSLGADNVEMFEEHASQMKSKVKAIELQVPHDIDFDWNVSNLEKGIEQGRAAARWAIERYEGMPKAELEQHGRVVRLGTPPHGVDEKSHVPGYASARASADAAPG